MADRIDIYLGRLKLILIVFLMSMFLFLIYRYFYCIHILPATERAEFMSDIVRSFIVGLQFDTVTICYGMVLPVLFAFSGLFVANEKWGRVIDKFMRGFLTFIITLFILILIIDYYYYNYFQAHFNILVLGLWDDDTKNVMTSVYTDYPLISVLVFVVIFFFFIRYLIRTSQKRCNRFKLNISFGLKCFIALVSTGVFAIGLRGSFGTFPVQVDDANISSNPKVNLLPVNGVFALKNVISIGVMQNKLVEFDNEIKRLGYANGEKAILDYFGKGANTDSYFTKTKADTFLEKNPPHVIFFLMESMSNNNLYLQSDSINVMGALEKYFNNGIVYRKFLPAQNGTINTLEALMVNTPITSLAQSKFGADTFPSAAAKPFYDKGYSTTFISGGKLNWRNINTFIPRQYFQKTEGNEDIKTANAKAEECEWGVFDEYLFDHVFHELETAKKPQFIFALSTTNHTPFHLPGNYKPYPVNLTDSVKGILQVEEERAKSNLTNFQYSNDCLGRFLDRLKTSPYGENTIVFATGDHNNLLLFDFTPGQLFYKLGVPLVMYIPEKFLKNSKVDMSRWGSHKDIFPTLYNLSLSGATYFNSGADLLSKDASHESFYAIDMMSYVAMNDKGAVRFDSKPETYVWANPHNLISLPQDQFSDSLLFRSRSYFAAFYHYIKGRE